MQANRPMHVEKFRGLSYSVASLYLQGNIVLNGFNHITLAVRDIDKSFDFYVSLLGFKPYVKWAKGAHLTVGNHWFCLSCDKSEPAKDYSHISFNVEKNNFAEISKLIYNANITIWKENRSEGKSIYFLDPDGHKLEIHSGDIKTRLSALKNKAYEGIQWF